MKVPVIGRVPRPRSGNLIHTVTQRIEAVRRNPNPLIPNLCLHPFTLRWSFHQWTHIPNCEWVKVNNTLIEYMTTRYLTALPAPVISPVLRPAQVAEQGPDQGRVERRAGNRPDLVQHVPEDDPPREER